MINYRKLQQPELTEIARLDAISNRSPWSLFDYQQSELNPAHYLIGMYREGEIIGCCLYSMVAGEAEILQFFIRYELQHQGYGKQLLQHILATLDAEDIEQTFLEVMVGNTPAINLYHQLGFNIIGNRKNYYHVDGKKIDALMMARQR